MAAVISQNRPVYGHVINTTHDTVTEGVVWIAKQGEKATSGPVVVSLVLTPNDPHGLRAVFLFQLEQLPANLSQRIVPAYSLPFAFTTLSHPLQRVHELPRVVKPPGGQPVPLAGKALAYGMIRISLAFNCLAVFNVNENTT
jgi:hypothetical protein